MSDYNHTINALIEALKIFAKYNVNTETCCEHEELYICGIEPENVSKEDIEKLDELGFIVEEGNNMFKSYRWGSC